MNYLFWDIENSFDSGFLNSWPYPLCETVIITSCLSSNQILKKFIRRTKDLKSVIATVFFKPEKDKADKEIVRIFNYLAESKSIKSTDNVFLLTCDKKLKEEIAVVGSAHLIPVDDEKCNLLMSKIQNENKVIKKDRFDKLLIAEEAKIARKIKHDQNVIDCINIKKEKIRIHVINQAAIKKRLHDKAEEKKERLLAKEEKEKRLSNKNKNKNKNKKCKGRITTCNVTSLTENSQHSNKSLLEKYAPVVLSSIMSLSQMKGSVISNFDFESVFGGEVLPLKKIFCDNGILTKIGSEKWEISNDKINSYLEKYPPEKCNFVKNASSLMTVLEFFKKNGNVISKEDIGRLFGKDAIEFKLFLTSKGFLVREDLKSWEINESKMAEYLENVGIEFLVVDSNAIIKSLQFLVRNGIAIKAADFERMFGYNSEKAMKLFIKNKLMNRVIPTSWRIDSISAVDYLINNNVKSSLVNKEVYALIVTSERSKNSGAMVRNSDLGEILGYDSIHLRKSFILKKFVSKISAGMLEINDAIIDRYLKKMGVINHCVNKRDNAVSAICKHYKESGELISKAVLDKLLMDGSGNLKMFFIKTGFLTKRSNRTWVINSAEMQTG